MDGWRGRKAGRQAGTQADLFVFCDQLKCLDALIALAREERERERERDGMEANPFVHTKEGLRVLSALADDSGTPYANR